jgi:hypothetical protein
MDERSGDKPRHGRHFMTDLDSHEQRAIAMLANRISTDLCDPVSLPL